MGKGEGKGKGVREGERNIHLYHRWERIAVLMQLAPPYTLVPAYENRKLFHDTNIVDSVTT